MASKVKPKKPRATPFACTAPDAKAVFLAGTFNNSNPAATPMKKDTGGNWSVAVSLPPGRYEYKFVVDGQWCCETGGDGQIQAGLQCVPNPFGSTNRVIDVAE